MNVQLFFDVLLSEYKIYMIVGGRNFLLIIYRYLGDCICSEIGKPNSFTNNCMYVNIYDDGLPLIKMMLNKIRLGMGDSNFLQSALLIIWCNQIFIKTFDIELLGQFITLSF